MQGAEFATNQVSSYSLLIYKDLSRLVRNLHGNYKVFFACIKWRLARVVFSVK